VPPGRSLHLLPAAPLPADLRWATGAPTVAAAFARASTVIEAAGRAAVPPAVRDKVRSELDEWTGAPPGPSRAWVQPAVAELSLEDRPAGRLALLTALASYQVDDRVVADYRAGNPDDRTLIEITAWASLAAARRLAQWAGAASHR
jgi:hypothetical protein